MQRLTDLLGSTAPAVSIRPSRRKPFVARYQADFDLALELLEGVAASWQKDDKPFWLFTQDQPGWRADLPEISLD